MLQVWQKLARISNHFRNATKKVAGIGVFTCINLYKIVQKLVPRLYLLVFFQITRKNRQFRNVYFANHINFAIKCKKVAKKFCYIVKCP